MKDYNSLTPAALWEPLVGPEGTASSAEPGGMQVGKDFVRCRLCAHYCAIPPNAFGKCGVRLNLDGSLFSAVVGRLAAVNLDPVEKKPLYHFLPGSSTFSLGTPGCNFRCSFCQNSELSQLPANFADKLRRLESGQPASAAGIVAAAQESGAASLAYTYNEPTMFFELLRETARQALDKGLRNIMVSNAYMSAECFAELRDLIQAANFDLKSFSPEFYHRLCGARLEPVLRTLEAAVRAGWLVEITTLIISGLNDSQAELDALAGFIAGSLGRDVPWHVSRFRPAYRMDKTPPTPLESLERAMESGQKHGLNHVYVGNLPGHASENTFCPQCGKLLVERRAYRVSKTFSGTCTGCGAVIPGIWG
ncbi:MAG: AmmeMemoRadiSam system radical SAM enzyme [Deltaproteobacteria bacterium]|nr:AmmeMemoRadiSam system radical SAM enzyme [Deltaproteobacteria bacterium]